MVKHSGCAAAFPDLHLLLSLSASPFWDGWDTLLHPAARCCASDVAAATQEHCVPLR